MGRFFSPPCGMITGRFLAGGGLPELPFLPSGAGERGVGEGGSTKNGAGVVPPQRNEMSTSVAGTNKPVPDRSPRKFGERRGGDEGGRHQLKRTTALTKKY